MDWLPDPMIRTLALAEDYGWGRRAILSGGPPRSGQRPFPRR